MLYLWTVSWHIFSFVFVFMLMVDIVDNIFSDSSLVVADYAFYIIHVVQVLAMFYAFSNQNLHTKGQFFFLLLMKQQTQLSMILHTYIYDFVQSIQD